MKKIIHPCTVDGLKAFAAISFEKDILTIHGVIGPTRDGNSKGGSGQCVDEIRTGKPVDDWNEEMLQKFCDIWDRYHSNDMRPYCEHQKELGWDKIAKKEVPLYYYTLTTEALEKQNKAKEAALTALKNGETFTPTKEQVYYANLSYFMTSYKEQSYNDKNYKPRKSVFRGDAGEIEYKKLGWLYPKDHPDGILCKPCPVCGYRYGSAWKKEEIPKEIIDWLFSLPYSKIKPAWI